ncbi:MAG: outer membrane beta-barrel protein [Nitrospirota bacterium]
MSRRYLVIILLGIGLGVLAGVTPAVADVEITPFAGLRFGGGFEDANTGTAISLNDSGSYGLAVDFDISPDQQIEIYLSRQSTTLSADGTFTGNPLFDLSVEYYHVGGLYLIDVENDRVRPFVSGSFGLTRLNPHGDELSTETQFSLALGGGAKFFITEHVGVRVDARGIYTALNSNGAVFCSGGCAISVQSSGFLQGELSAGVVVRF